MTYPNRSIRQHRRRSVATAIAAAVLVLLATVAPVTAQPDAGSADDLTGAVIRPKFWRVDSTGSNVLSSTVVRSDIWVRVQFVDQNGNNVGDLSNFGENTLTVTNGSVVNAREHHPGSAWLYEVRADECSSTPSLDAPTNTAAVSPSTGEVCNEVTTMSVSVAANQVADDNGNGNAAGSTDFTVETPFTPVLSTTAVEPVLSGSFSIAVDTIYDVEAGTSSVQRASFVPSADISATHGGASNDQWTTVDDSNYRGTISNYGNYVGYLKVQIPADRFGIDGSRTEWNHASNEIKVFVGPPFTIGGASAVDYWHQSTAAVGTYTTSEGAGTVTWSLTGDDSDDFSITSAGVLSFTSDRDYTSPTDADSDNVYKVTLNAASDDHAYAEDLGGGFTATKDVTVTVDKAPEVSSVAFTSDPGDDDTYAIGDTIEATVTYDEPVTLKESGSESLEFGLYIDIGSSSSSTQVLAEYDRTAGDSGLVFAYTVAESLGAVDDDGIAISNLSLQLSNGTLKDRTDNDASKSLEPVAANSGHKVDAVRPTVSDVSITTEPETGDTYAKAETVKFSVEFSEAATISGSPQLKVDVGGVEKTAAFVGLSESNTVASFHYTVLPGDSDEDGLTVDADSLDLNEGTIADAAGNAATLSHTGLTTTQKVFGALAHVKEIVVSEPLDEGETYSRGKSLLLYVSFVEESDPEDVTVTGSPQLALDIGGIERLAKHSHTYDNLVWFRYTFVIGDNDSDGITIPANALRLNGGTIHDSDDNVPALLDHDAVATGLNSSVPPAQVLSVEFDNKGGDDTPGSEPEPYKKNETIKVFANFDYAVEVTGTPQIAIDIGGTTRYANYREGSGRDALTFAYTVVPGDVDDDGISIPENAIRLNGGTINENGHAATLTHDEVTSTDNVAAPVASVSTLGISSGAGEDDTYSKGDRVLVNLHYDETVTVTGKPQLALDIGGTERIAEFFGDDQSVLIFAYYITTGDTDTDGISVPANAIRLNGGTITDRDDEVPASLKHDALASQERHKVSAPYAVISSISFSDSGIYDPGGDDTYGNGDTIRVEVEFSEAVTVEDNEGVEEPKKPSIEIVIGDNRRTAEYDSVSGNTVYFTYTVVVGDVDTDGISLNHNALSLNDSSIKDSVGVAARIAHNPVAASSGHKVSAPGGV